ncbi:putative retrotransposon gag protein, partial [Neofusicoccum parvum]
FGNDADKVRYASTFLRGAAEKWFRPYKRETQEKPHWQWSLQTQAIFSDYRTFAKQLQDAFSTIDEAKRTNQILFRIQQKKSVLDYTAEFQEAAYVAGEHSDYTLRQLYYRGLKDEIKEAMSYHDEPETLSELVRLATDMDRRRTNRWFEKKGGYQANTNKPRRERTTLEGGDAMALDAASRQDSKKGNNNKRNDKKPKGSNPNWTDEQKQRYKDRLCIIYSSDKHFLPTCPENCNRKRGKQTSSAQREASVVSRQENHDALSWTACFNDDCTTHQSDKDATGWYPRKPRGLAMLTRNEEVLDLDDIIESFPHDDEIVNSENGEFYDSTEAEEDSSDEKDLAEVEESPLAGAINRLLEKVEEHGIMAKIPLHHGESEQGIWIPDNQPGLALVTWQTKSLPRIT